MLYLIPVPLSWLSSVYPETYLLRDLKNLNDLDFKSIVALNIVYSPEVPQEAKAGPVEEAQNDECDAKINEYKERLRRQKEEFQAKKAKEEAERIQKQEEENRKRKEAEEFEEKRKEQLKQEKIQEMNNQIEVSFIIYLTLMLKANRNHNVF